MSVIAISLETGLPSFYAVCQNATCTGYFLGAMQICIARTSYGNVSVWLAVRHSRYCPIKTTKPILKLFRPSGSPSQKHSGPLAPIPNSKGTPSSGR